MKRLFFYFTILLLIQSCCSEFSYYDSESHKINDKLSLAVESTDNNGNLNYVTIDSVEWIGSDYVQPINDYYAKDLRVNINRNVTQFKLIHQNGIDTVSFYYDWMPISYNSCYKENSKIERNYKIIKISSNRGSIDNSYSNEFVLRLN